MNRRDFNAKITAAIATSAFSAIAGSRAHAHIVANQASQESYRYRLRYSRKLNAYSFWVRISDTQMLDDDVAFSLILSTDRAGTNVIHRRATVARVLDSHVVRMQVLNLSEGGWTPGSPLYGRLAIGTNNLQSKVWKLYRS